MPSPFDRNAPVPNAFTSWCLASLRHTSLLLGLLLASPLQASPPEETPNNLPRPTDSVRPLTGLHILQHALPDGSLLPIQLQGSDARWQLVVAALPTDGDPFDITHLAKYEVAPPSLARIDSLGRITPNQNGTGTLTVRYQDQSTSTPLTIRDLETTPPVNFPNQVVPIFTKLGCNGGGCHGKASGQNGFRLSLLGFEPHEDYEHLVLESRGRRLAPASPDQSLLLTKSLNTAPHGGGQRLQADSHEYRLLRRWIAQAMPYGSNQDPKVVRIHLLPSEQRLPRDSQQQLSVLAEYSNGLFEDITQTAQYESNQPDMAEVSTTGLIKTHDMAGDVAIMARYQGQVAVFQASIPLGATTADFPPARNRIDQAVFQKLHTLGIPTAPPCDDATFLRRVTLDIAGRLPSPSELQAFVPNPDPNKRDLAIQRLLESPDYADHFSMKWNAILRNQRGGPDTRFGAYAFREWIREAIHANRPYDEWVKELLTASGSAEEHPAVIWLREVSNTEARVEDTAQLFLGQRIQCARCHHHPYEKWSQKDYYQLAAFFSQIENKEGRSKQEAVFISRLGHGTARHPKTGESLNAQGLDAPAIADPPTRDPRESFADWLVAKENPFFAKSLANRYWKHFFGKGLVEPEDDMRITNPPSNPQLLDALSQILIENHFDLKHLIREICNSHTYQLAATADSTNIQDQNSFSRFYPRRLSAEVLLDAIDSLCGTHTPFENLPTGTRAVALPDTSFPSYFLTVFGRPDSSTSCECERTQTANLAQSLHLLNSKEMQSKLSDAHGRAASLAQRGNDDPTLVQALEELYTIAFARSPSESERNIALQYLQPRRDHLAKAYEDLIWAMINSKEFLFQH